MAQAAFNLDQARLAAARSLPENCFDDFQRLSKTLLYGPPFQWLLVDAPHDGLRRQLMQALDSVLSAAKLRVNRLPLSARIADVAGLEARLVKNAAQADVVHVIGPPGWFTPQRWDEFNVRRERIAAGARARLVFWLDGEAIALASQGAPDLWAWRSGVYAFSVSAPDAAMPASLPMPPPQPLGVDNRTMAARHRRVMEIKAWLAAHQSAPHELLVAPYDELVQLLFSLGEFDDVLQLLSHVVLPLHRQRGADGDAAVAQTWVGDALRRLGRFDEALRTYRDEALPVFDRLGDARNRAVTLGKVAEILRTRGQAAEALRIRQDELLPFFERIGDARERAVTQLHIANDLRDLGQLDEALRMLRDEALPALDKLGHLRERAIAQGQIADILQLRGQFDEALRIRREEELPIYEKLGDVLSRTVAQGQIADILHARGHPDEALRIRRDETLPSYERLGDRRSAALTRWKIGRQWLELGKAAEARSAMQQALDELKAMALPEAEMLEAELGRLAPAPTSGLA